MKKLFTVLAMFFMFFCIPVSADSDDYALELFDELIESYHQSWSSEYGYSALEGFSITSGLPADGDNSFGFTRTVKGTAPKDTVVSITVFLYNGTELYAANSIELEPVGAIGFFDKSIQLYNGDNYVLVTATNGQSCALATSLIKCKDTGIKELLENSIVLPGHLMKMGSEQNDY